MTTTKPKANKQPKVKATKKKVVKTKPKSKKVVKRNKAGVKIPGFVRELDNGNYLVNKGHKHFLYEQGKKGGNASFYFDEDVVMVVVQEYISEIGIKTKQYKDDNDILVKEKVLNFPSIDELGDFMEIANETLYDWIKKSQRLANAVQVIKRKQKNLLLKGGLTGELRENMSRFVLTVNHGMVDKQEIDNTFRVADVNINLPDPELKIIDVDLIEQGDE